TAPKEKKVKIEEAPEVDFKVDKPAGPKVVGRVELEKPKVKTAAKAKKEEAPAPLQDEAGPVADQAEAEKEAAPAASAAQAEPAVPEPPTAPVEDLIHTTKASDLIGEVKVVGKIDIDSINQRTRPQKRSVKAREERAAAKEAEETKPAADAGQAAAPAEAPVERQRRMIVQEGPDHKIIRKLAGPTVVGKIDLAATEKKKTITTAAAAADDSAKKKKRKRIRKDKVSVSETVAVDKDAAKVVKKKAKVKKRVVKVEISEEDVQRQIKDTLARITPKGKSKGSKYRRTRREQFRQTAQADAERMELESHIIKVTEFVTANELANLMNVQVNEIIATCMSLGLFVSINQRLDAETISVVADEFGFEVEFISVEVQESIEVSEDNEEDLKPRPPIVTVMGHVDHGKTSLLDHIRKTNIIAGEAGGITQHIGAYKVVLENGKTITFLDTPGHEAFTAMRARGAQVTDIAIIVIAADDSVMPQTVEAINHATAAGVPIVFAINKIDKEGAHSEKIKEQLANMNLLVEDWGGKYQSQEISAKKGIGVLELLEKVLLEAEMLDLKANPDKKAVGSVIESSLDKGRGYVTNLLLQAGSMAVGDIVLAGSYFGRIKAMMNERGNVIKKAGPSEPVVVLGLNGAPQAGDKFHVMETEKEAREIATKREQLQREQEMRARKHITLDEIGRRIAIGNFQELNIIVKGDVDGSIEALSDSLLKLSTPEIQVNIIHKAVGQISESDILLASASNAIVVGFQVRPSLSARKLAEKEGIEVRLYSIIYDAINEIKAAMEGMLSPEIKEEITGTLEVLEAFKITKVGTVAGCIVRDGKIFRGSSVRIIRDGIVVYDGLLGSLKRFKDDVKEVTYGLECGLNIDNYNDIKQGDIIEAYTSKSVKKTL
ncbi:MAG: translation initiation factor IF-2, partial [Bacteroidales bacterium]